jgi:putative tryptophan/tyrosine transport system substrate-binding protein
MRLIWLAVVLTVGLTLGPLAAEAQPAGKVWRIGWLGISGSAPLEALVAGLRERGYVEGQNIVIERRYSEGREERFPGYVAELVQMKVDLILVVNTQGALAAKAATSSIPIVLAGVLDPERTGLVASLGRPGANVTGISNQVFEVQSKHFQLIKEALPHLTRLAVLWNPANAASALAWKGTDGQARTLGIATISGPIANPDELERTLAAVATQRPSGLYVHLIMGPYRPRIIEFALSQRLPTFASDSRWAEAGALLTYGANGPDMLRRAAAYVDRILKGAKPSDLPVEQPTKFDLVINLKTAKALGLTIPQSILLRADEVIQ